MRLLIRHGGSRRTTPWWPNTLGVVVIGMMVACGGRSALPGGGARDDAEATTPAGLPASDCSDGVIPDPAPSCGPLSITHTTRSTCAIRKTDCSVPLDAEGFQPGRCPIGEPGCADEAALLATAYRVLALNRYGAGHVVGWCDTTTLGDLDQSTPLMAYLGQTASPRVASFGPGYGCNPEPPGGTYAKLSDVTYLGATLPDTYTDNPAELAADWDVVVWCPMTASPADIEPVVPVLDAFVGVHGRGLWLSMDYAAAPTSLVHPTVSELSAPMGFTFDPVVLGPATMDLDAACVADL